MKNKKELVVESVLWLWTAGWVPSGKGRWIMRSHMPFGLWTRESDFILI